MGKILKAKYYPTTNFLQASLGHSPSYMSARHVLLRGGMWRIGNGYDVEIFGQRWVNGLQHGGVFGPPTLNQCNMKVCDLIDSESGSWDNDKLNECLVEEEVNKVLNIQLPPSNTNDTFCWPLDKFGRYLVKSGYSLLRYI